MVFHPRQEDSARPRPAVRPRWLRGARRAFRPRL